MPGVHRRDGRVTRTVPLPEPPTLEPLVMPEVTSPYAPGTPCWIDLSVPDQRAALDFYRDLFGWQGEPGPPETGGYAVCTLRGSRSRAS